MIFGEYVGPTLGFSCAISNWSCRNFCHDASMSADKSVPKRFHRESTEPDCISWQFRLTPGESQDWTSLGPLSSWDCLLHSNLMRMNFRQNGTPTYASSKLDRRVVGARYDSGLSAHKCNRPTWKRLARSASSKSESLRPIHFGCTGSRSAAVMYSTPCDTPI